jgi:putative transposase
MNSRLHERSPPSRTKKQEGEVRTSFTQMYVHCVWATWNREPLITPAVQGMIYGAIVHQCEVLKCTVIAIGGIEDHVHLLVGFPPTLAVSELVKKVKGTSSHLVNSKNDGFFKWQGAYGAFYRESSQFG